MTAAFLSLRRDMNASRFVISASCFALATSPLLATTVGLPGTAGSFFSTWDTFPSVTFTNDTPDASGSGLFNASLTSAYAGGMVLGSGDRLYSGSGATPNAVNLTINGTATASITTLSLVIKFSPPSVGTAENFFTITMDGTSSDSFPIYLGNSQEGANNFQIYQWTWSGLNLANGSDFAFSIGSGSDHISIDALQLSNMTAVPEPSAFGLMAAALGGFVLRRSRARRA